MQILQSPRRHCKKRNLKADLFGNVLKSAHALFLPYVHIKDCYFLFSETDSKSDFFIGENSYKKAKIFTLDKNGQKFFGEMPVKGTKLSFEPQKSTAYLFYFE